MGLCREVIGPFLFPGMSLWANVGGNPSGNFSAGRPWYFKLIWENNCSASSRPCGFTLYPDNPQYLPELAVDASSQAGKIKSAELLALKKAFEPYPVNVSEGRANTGANRAWVEDGISYEGGIERCGGTFEVNQHDSTVYYLKNMSEAQFALPLVLETPADVQAALTRSDLMKAIGTGIGNNAAHEIGHQFLGKQFGLDDTSSHTYNGQGCSGEGAPWVYGIGAITWGSVTAGAWQSRLSRGWHN